ncbi:patatin-like phospholipase family protein [bacterium]|nr:patatin-like phospholipase family protein [bacterium]MCB2179344.1 patatin-like phospholipase family protein [bacterium]
MEYDLVFEGGGAKGMVFVGALYEFTRRGHTCGRLMGTSAGAIAATLTAAGYTPEEMLAALAEKDAEGHPVFASFMGTPGNFPDAVVSQGAFSQLLKNFDIPMLPDFIEVPIENLILKFFAEKNPANNVFSLVELGGWYAADHFIEWLQAKLDSGTFNGQTRHFSRMSMQEFFQATGKDLTLIAADTTGEEMLVINHRTAPDCPVVWAVRMSMSIPLLWQEVIWRREWGAYRGIDISGHAVVDGGVLSNFPIELFISRSANVTAVMGKKHHENVLGLLIDEKVPVPGVIAVQKTAKKGLDVGELHTVRRLSGLMNTVLGARDKAVIAAFEHLVVRLPAKGYGTVEFDMSDERRNLLVEAGRQTMMHYFDHMQSASGPKPLSGEALTGTGMADKVAERFLE